MGSEAESEGRSRSATRVHDALISTRDHLRAMKLANCVVIGLTLVLASGCCAPQPRPPVNVQFSIGNQVVTAEVFQRGAARPVMLNVHDDEDTSVAAGKIVIEQTGGRLIQFSHSGRGNIRFTLNGERYAFDPNRIFSDAGIRDTLKRQSSYSDAAHRAVKRFATQYFERFALDREPAIIALHNNSDKTLSIHSYETGGEHAAATKAVHIAPNRDPDDFFYVTDERFFDYLKARDFNVMLQDNANAPDDGSLSVYFGQKGIPYVNIEAEEGHLNAQIEMVRVACEMFGALKLLTIR
jgi:hypothetical protein